MLSTPDIQYVVTYHFNNAVITILRIHHTRENRERP